MLLKSRKILLLGSSGKLGSFIKKSKLFSNLICPEKSDLDLRDKESILKTLSIYEPQFIINCAALARRKICQKDPKKAILINTVGTANLAMAVLEYSKKTKSDIRVLHISTDAVYSNLGGNHKESDATFPMCNYSITKLAAECSIRMIPNHLIVRTRFFSSLDIKFKDAAEDIFTSSIEIVKLVDILNKLLKSNYIGIVNIGDKKLSDFERYSKFDKSIKKTTRKKIENESRLIFYEDYSMNLENYKKIISNSI